MNVRISCFYLRKGFAQLVMNREACFRIRHLEEQAKRRMLSLRRQRIVTTWRLFGHRTHVSWLVEQLDSISSERTALQEKVKTLHEAALVAETEAKIQEDTLLEMAENLQTSEQARASLQMRLDEALAMIDAAVVEATASSGEAANLRAECEELINDTLEGNRVRYSRALGRINGRRRLKILKICFVGWASGIGWARLQHRTLVRGFTIWRKMQLMALFKDWCLGSSIKMLVDRYAGYERRVAEAEAERDRCLTELEEKDCEVDEVALIFLTCPS